MARAAGEGWGDVVATMNALKGVAAYQDGACGHVDGAGGAQARLMLAQHARALPGRARHGKARHGRAAAAPLRRTGRLPHGCQTLRRHGRRVLNGGGGG